jgi:hypothetical protein
MSLGAVARLQSIVELECVGVGILAHSALNAVELTVTDPQGNHRTWIGADLAPTVALRLCAAVVRLIGGDPT